MQFRNISNLVSIVISLGCVACAPEAGTEVASSQSLSANLGRTGTRAEQVDATAAEGGDRSRRYRMGREFRQALAGSGAADSQGSRRWRQRAQAGAPALPAAAGAPAPVADGGGDAGGQGMSASPSAPEMGEAEQAGVPSQPGGESAGAAPSQPAAAMGGSAASTGSAGAGGASGSRRRAGSAGSAGSAAQPSAAGAGGSAAQPSAPVSSAPAQPSAARWAPAPSSTWQIQYQGSLDTSVDASVWDIDLYDTSAAQIGALHAAGRKVICYLDTAYEPNRPDSAQLAPYKGQPIDGWPGQYWVDVRQPAVLEVMRARIALAADKGCDAIDADDIDVRSNDSGFSISAAEQRSFITALADAAHARGMAYGMKNALEDVSALVSHVDFAVNEQCFEYNECAALQPFVAAGKAVFNIEYSDGSLSDKGASICPQASKLGFSTLIKRLSLNAERYSCR